MHKILQKEKEQYREDLIRIIERKLKEKHKSSIQKQMLNVTISIQESCISIYSVV